MAGGFFSWPWLAADLPPSRRRKRVCVLQIATLILLQTPWPSEGQAILLAARAFRASELFAGIVLLGLIGLVSNALLALAEAQWLKWQRR